MKRLLSSLLAICLLAGLAGCAMESPQGNESGLSASSHDFFAMNTYIRLEAYGDGAEDALALAQARIEELEGLWSVTDETSDIYAVNHSAGSRFPSVRIQWSLFPLRWKWPKKQRRIRAHRLLVLTAWGFTTDEHRVPSQEEI